MEFKREAYLKKLISYENNSLVKVITGARRSGKSYFMNRIFYSYLISRGVPSDHIIRFAFDNDEDLDLLESFYPQEQTRIFAYGGTYTVNSKKFRAYIKSLTTDSGTYYLLLDEIQILDSFVTTLNGFLTHMNFDVYVSGSNSQLLSSEIETKFRGAESLLFICIR